MWAMKKFRHYLLGRKFIARVDHKPLVSLLKNPMTPLTEEYLEGKKNTLADALSRSYEVNVIEDDDKAKKFENDKWQADLKNCILVKEVDRKDLVEKTHLLGYFGVKSIIKKLVNDGYWWPKMKKDVRKVVLDCEMSNI